MLLQQWIKAISVLSVHFKILIEICNSVLSKDLMAVSAFSGKRCQTMISKCSFFMFQIETWSTGTNHLRQSNIAIWSPILAVCMYALVKILPWLEHNLIGNLFALINNDIQFQCLSFTSEIFGSLSAPLLFPIYFDCFWLRISSESAKTLCRGQSCFWAVVQ